MAITSEKAARSRSRTARRVGKRKALQVVLVLVALLIIGGNVVARSLGADTPPARGAEGSALAALASLPVRAAAPVDGFDRDGDFGGAWQDADGNGCDTRNGVLARDLQDITYSPGSSCEVASGTLRDPYTGETVRFRHGEDSGAVEVDRVVALLDAWATGAQDWDQDERVAFANDPLNLVAADGAAVAAKDGAGAARWLPDDHAYRCPYVARQIAVKAEYGLWVTQAEHDAMESVLLSCPAEPLPSR